MKKCVTILLSAALLCFLWVPAWAVEAEDNGIYDVSDPTVISSLRTAVGEAATPIDEDTFGTYYSGAERFSVTCSGAVSGKQYTVFVVAGSGEPNSTNLAYIDQKTATGDTVSFDVYPNLKKGDYSVYVTGDTMALNTSSPLATFTYNTVVHCDLTVRVTGAGSSGLLVGLVRKGTPVAEVSPTESQGAVIYSYDQLLGGPFTATVTKDGYVGYTSSFTLSQDTTLTVPLVVKGNINGAKNAQGKDTSTEDMQCLFTYLSTNVKEGALADADSEYFRQVCDFNEDGSVNILDYQALYEYITHPAS